MFLYIRLANKKNLETIVQIKKKKWIKNPWLHLIYAEAGLLY